MNTGAGSTEDRGRLCFEREDGKLEFILSPLEGLVVAAADRDGAEIDLILTARQAAVLGRWVSAHFAVDVEPQDLDPIEELVRLINQKPCSDNS